MAANRDSVIELGLVPPLRDTRARSSSYSMPKSTAAAVAAQAALHSSQNNNKSNSYTDKYSEKYSSNDSDSDSDSPHTKQKRSAHKVAIGVVVVLQCVSLVLAVLFFDKWYSITPFGSSALVSCLLCGFAQGLLQLIVYRHAKPGNLLKYYVWGVLNGIWTVSTLLFISVVLSYCLYIYFFTSNTPSMQKWWTDNLSNSVSNIPLRIICDQIIGNPTNLIFFLSFVSYWDGRDINQYFQLTYLKMLKTSYIIWPLASTIQFYFLEPRFLVPFNSVINVFWTVILGILAG